MSDDDLVSGLLEDARERMQKCVDVTRHEFGSVRTGRANPALLDRDNVDYYGAVTPLKKLATIGAPESRMISIQPYDKSSIMSIEKAILESDVGLTPSNDGAVIRLVLPELTEERRKELVKVVRHKAEDAKVAVRNLRRSGRHELDALQKDGSLSTDELDRVEKELDKITQEQVSAIDQLLAQKERELLQV